MSTIKIKELRDRLGVSQEKLANMLGVHTRTIQNWEAGGKIPNAKHAILHRIEMGETLELRVTDDTQQGKSERKLIPFYDDPISIGGIERERASDESIISPSEYIDIGDWFRDATAALRHYGDSMKEYPPGCILTLKEVKERRLIVWGNDYTIETPEYRITKKVQRGDTTDAIRAYSTNEDTYKDGRLVHEPIDVLWNDIRRIFLVLGYVVIKNGGVIVYSNFKK